MSSCPKHFKLNRAAKQCARIVYPYAYVAYMLRSSRPLRGRMNAEFPLACRVAPPRCAPFNLPFDFRPPVLAGQSLGAVVVLVVV